MDMARSNLYPGICSVCKSTVAASAGFTERSPQGAWIVKCKACSGVVQDAKPRITLSQQGGDVVFKPASFLGGNLFTSYLAAIKGATFDATSRTNVAPLGQVAEKIQNLQAAGFLVDIPPSLASSLQAKAAEIEAGVQKAASRADETDRKLQERGLALFPFQRVGCQWLASRSAALLCDDMGLGKTIQALLAIPEGAPVLVIGPAVAKGVWRDEAGKWRPDLEVAVLSGRGSFRYPNPGEIVVTNYDVLSDDPGVAPPGCIVIADECFPYEAEVLTDLGPLPIGEIVEKVLDVSVLSCDSSGSAEWKKVTRWVTKPLTRRLVRVIHEHGSFVCTENHKIWTESGYVQALSLNSSHVLRWVSDSLQCSEKRQVHTQVLLPQLQRQAYQSAACRPGEDLCGSKEAHPRKVMRNVWGELFVSVERGDLQPKEVLWETVLGSVAYESTPMEGSAQDRDGREAQSKSRYKRPYCCGTHAAEKSDARPAHSRKNAKQADRTDVSCSGWEWAADRTSNPTSRGSWLAHGGCGCHGTRYGSIPFPASKLQGGRWQSRPETCNRSGRQNAHLEEVEIPGPSKGVRFEGSRVVSVEVLECGDPGRPSFGPGSNQVVYDLEVESNHNYFADGVLVSNCHALKNAKSARTTRFRETASRARKVDGKTWLLTATPLMNRPQELWSVLQAAGLGAAAFGSWDAYKDLYDARTDSWGGTVWGSPSPEIPTRLQKVMLRREKVEVLKDLPTKMYRELSVEVGLPARDRKAMDRLTALWDEYSRFNRLNDEPRPSDIVATETQAERNALEEQLGSTSLEDLEEAEKLLKNASGLTFRQMSEVRAALATAKIPALLDLVGEYEEQEEPIVVFSAHRAPIDHFAGREGWAVITGDTSPTDRKQIQDDFQAGKLRGVAATIKAGGVALTLTRACNVIFVDLDWSPALNIQAEDRVLRIGQLRPVLVTLLVSTFPLDQRVTQLLSSKKTLIRNTVQAAARTAVEIDLPTLDLADLTREIETEKAREEAAQKAAEERAREFASITPSTTPEEDRQELRRRTREERWTKEASSEPQPRRLPSTPREAWMARSLQTLARLDPDRALIKNDAGFSASDGTVGHKLAFLSSTYGLTEAQWGLAAVLCSRYHRQVGAAEG